MTQNCNSGVCGTGLGNYPKPGDPDNNSILTATPAFGGIDVSWTYPGLNPQAVAHVIVYRGTSAVAAYSTRHAVVNGSLFFDKSTSQTPVEYFYWIQIVSVNGTYGELIGPASAIAQPPIAQVIENLTGQIDAGALAQSLKQQIDQIQLNALGITQEMVERAAADDALGVALNEVIAFTDETRALMQQEVLARTDADEAFVGAVTTLQAQLEDTTAAVQDVQQALVDETSALAQDLTTVQVALNGNQASGQVGLVAQVEEFNGKITEIGALYTAKVNVNGLIGGFGVYNDGQEVEAGFDVDRFWIGRTSELRRKPFIVADGKVLIDEAVIDRLTFDKLRAADGSLIVENGKIQADYIQADQLVVGIDNVDGLGGLAALDGLGFGDLTGPKPPVDATRNVFRGDWLDGEAYVVGDQVIDQDYSWSCILDHAAEPAKRPPVYPGRSNDWWILAAVKGSPARSVALSATSQVFKVAKSGAVSPSYIRLTATGQHLSGLPVFSVEEGEATLQGSGDVRTLAHADMLSDAVTLKVTWGDQADTLTVVKLYEGSDAVLHRLLCDAKTLSRASDGSYSRNQVLFTAQKQVGDQAPVAYAGRFNVMVSADGENFVGDYQSPFDEFSLPYTLPPDIKAVRVELYAAGGFTELHDSETVHILEEGKDAVSYDLKIESTNGDQFRVGQSTTTLLKARVFRNGVEVTDEIPADKFSWVRVSYYPQPAPNDDATWNSLYASGYKQIQIDVDSVYARATFHCYITD